MFIKLARLTNLLNEFIGKKHIFGTTDCNLIIAKYIDLETQSDYYSQLVNTYNDVTSGIESANNIGFISAKHILEKVATKVESPKDGDIVVKEHKYKDELYYSTSIVWNKKGLAEKNNHYMLVNIDDIEYDEVYRLGE